MSAYLYTWNPNRASWVDQGEAIYRVSKGAQYDICWSCGNTKKIQIGDIFFLMRLGVDPKGIIGCGYISSAPYTTLHWDEEKAAEGKTSQGTDLLFRALSDEPIFSLVELQRRHPDYNWTPQAGGTTVPESIAEELFAQIQLSATHRFAPETPAGIALYAEGKPKTVTSRTYDRSPHARQACIEHYGHDCFVCGFNFELEYGSMGATYIEVHHLRQIADVGEEYLIDPIKDLRPVCANCHRMLHRRKQSLSIEELLGYSNKLASRLNCLTNCCRPVLPPEDK